MSESPKGRTGSNRRVFERVMLLALLALVSAACQPKVKTTLSQPSDLLKLFSEWRAFERPPQLDGAPDYTAETFAQRQRDYQQLRQRLEAMDPSRWPIPEQVDWHLVRAEMNGFDFNHRVLKPWVRDPAFYQSIMYELTKAGKALLAEAVARYRLLEQTPLEPLATTQPKAAA